MALTPDMVGSMDYRIKQEAFEPSEHEASRPPNVEPFSDPTVLGTTEIPDVNRKQNFDYTQYLEFSPKVEKSECKLCQRELSFQGMKKHFEKIHLNIIMNYFFCHVQYNDDVEVTEHMDEHEIIAQQAAETELKKAKTKFKCKNCRKGFSSSKLLANHIKTSCIWSSEYDHEEELVEEEEFYQDDYEYKPEPKLEPEVLMKIESDEGSTPKAKGKKINYKKSDNGKFICEEHHVQFDSRTRYR